MQVHTPERIRKIQFRVLIIGRANAGKTSILQRVCETTDSPILYRLFRGKEKVILNPSMDRGEHWIDDELIFSNHKGYVFHDSRGIESGSTEELKIVQEFIRRKSEETRLQDRLHAIWFDSRVFAIMTTDSHILRYCIPMDNQRPQLDLKFFKDICPNKNVPVIAVFTKFDQFRRNVQIHVEDFGSPNDDVLDVTEKQFREHYLSLLGGARFVRLEKMHMPNGRCDDLIEITVAALKDDVVASMLLAVQSGNLESSVKAALYGVRPEDEQEHKVQECLRSFPYIWASVIRVLIRGTHLMTLDAPQLPSVGYCCSSQGFKAADNVCPRSPDMSGYCDSLGFKVADDARLWLSRE
ncbi:hypothetical protein EDB89DRAFT_2072651 [Lactarius sanguifluus]|nr:hypothetical protein EDB89DRAFT_2072651 [Lactarius sanguifluus]